MKQNYDLGPGPLYIKLVENKQNVRTVNLSDEVKPDFTTGELSVVIEILEARESLDKSTVQNHI